jgi:hypothetical protein
MMSEHQANIAAPTPSTFSNTSIAEMQGWQARQSNSNTASIPVPPRLTRTPPATLKDEIYEVLATSKVRISQVAAHLPDNIRRRLFAQLDRLHDIEDWEAGDRPVLLASFQTFLRVMLIMMKAVPSFRWPNLGLSFKGNLVASWGTQMDHLALEFLSGDRVQWSLSIPGRDEQGISTVGGSAVLDLLRCLRPYTPEHWFDAHHQHPRP